MLTYQMVSWWPESLLCDCVWIAGCRGSISYSYSGLCNSSYSKSFSHCGKPSVYFISYTLDPRYNSVIGHRHPYRACYNEDHVILKWTQKMLVSLSCHFIISLIDCWVMHGVLYVLRACLSTSLRRILCVLLGCYDLLCAHYCSTECTSAESTNLFLSLLLYYIHVHTCMSCLHLSSFGQCLKHLDPCPEPHYNQIRIILKCVITRVQCMCTLMPIQN